MPPDRTNLSTVDEAHNLTSRLTYTAVPIYPKSATIAKRITRGTLLLFSCSMATSRGRLYFFHQSLVAFVATVYPTVASPHLFVLGTGLVLCNMQPPADSQASFAFFVEE